MNLIPTKTQKTIYSRGFFLQTFSLAPDPILSPPPPPRSLRPSFFARIAITTKKKRKTSLFLLRPPPPHTRHRPMGRRVYETALGFLNSPPLLMFLFLCGYPSIFYFCWFRPRTILKRFLTFNPHT